MIEPPATPPQPRKRRRRHVIHGMMPEDIPAMTGARAFVTIVFLLIGGSFVASTAIFIDEFRDHEWLSLTLLHSHLFLFFPTLGLLALVAFHLPATVFTNMYWNHISHGRIRFMIGTVVVIALSWYFSAHLLNTGPHEIWEIKPAVLTADKADQAPCNEGQQSCRRLGLLEAVKGLRRDAEGRFGVSKFARVCKNDALLEVPLDFTQKRFCFASGSMLSGQACCTAQQHFADHLEEMWLNPANRSRTDAFDIIALPLKTFFVLVVVVIGVLLVIWRRLLKQHYEPIAPVIERSLLIGAVAMLPWPFMDYAYVQAIQTLSGRMSAAPQLRLSLIIAPWALLLLVFFLGRMSRKIERLGQLAGAVVSLIALLRYEQLNDVALLTLGIAAPFWIIAALPLLSVVCLMALRWPAHLQRSLNGVFGRYPEVTPAPVAQELPTTPHFP